VFFLIFFWKRADPRGRIVSLQATTLWCESPHAILRMEAQGWVQSVALDEVLHDSHTPHLVRLWFNRLSGIAKKSRPRTRGTPVLYILTCVCREILQLDMSEWSKLVWLVVTHALFAEKLDLCGR
jgi:hypothetical protein